MSLLAAARRLAKLLAATGHKIVFAESCTGGLASAALAQVPGISAFHCGGVVTYRDATKTAYLGIDPKVLQRPGAVSAKVTDLMARAVFEKTPEATVAVAITGHLGPNAPLRLDGVIFLAARACGEARRASPYETTIARRIVAFQQLNRAARQKFAAEEALRLAAEVIQSISGFRK